MTVRVTCPSMQRIAMPWLALGLSACAPAPIYHAAPGTLSIAPAQVAQAPASYLHQQVIWGGSVVSVRNDPDHTEIEVLAYPLDSSQRPQPNSQGAGRFIAIYPGYVEAYNYPAGSLITVQGSLQDSRAGLLGQTAYTYPVVAVSQSHRWTGAELRAGHPDIHFGIGVAGGFR